MKSITKEIIGSLSSLEYYITDEADIYYNMYH